MSDKEPVRRIAKFPYFAGASFQGPVVVWNDSPLWLWHPNPYAVNLFVIYERPADYPNHFAVRRWEDDQPTNECQLADSLEEARKLIPPYAGNQLARAANDDPVIVEVWI